MGGVIQGANPAGLHETPGSHHVTNTNPPPMVFLAGQCPLEKSVELAGGGDLRAQVDPREAPEPR